jgi:hypothetical protein
MIALIKVYAEKPVDAVTVTRDKTVRLRTQPIADDRKTKNRPQWQTQRRRAEHPSGRGETAIDAILPVNHMDFAHERLMIELRKAPLDFRVIVQIDELDPVEPIQRANNRFSRVTDDAMTVVNRCKRHVCLV